MTRAFPLFILFLPALLGRAAAAQAAADSVVYGIHPASRLVVKTGKAGLFGFAGHTHVIRAREVSGRLVYHPGEARSRLRLEVPTKSLEVLTPPDTAEIRKVTEAMREDVLHVDRFPTMSFAADSLNARSGRMDLQLAVTLEGVTRLVPVTADVTVGTDSVRATGSFTVKQTDFGIQPYSGGPAGTVKVADRVTFCFDLLGVRGLDERQAVATGDGTTVPGCVDKAKSRGDTARRVM